MSPMKDTMPTSKMRMYGTSRTLGNEKSAALYTKFSRMIWQSKNQLNPHLVNRCMGEAITCWEKNILFTFAKDILKHDL